MSLSYQIETMNEELKRTIEQTSNYIYNLEAYKYIYELEQLSTGLHEAITSYESLSEKLSMLLPKLDGLTSERILKYRNALDTETRHGKIVVKKFKRDTYSYPRKTYTEYTCNYSATTESGISIMQSSLDAKWEDATTKSKLIDRVFISLTNEYEVHPKNIKIVDLT